MKKNFIVMGESINNENELVKFDSVIQCRRYIYSSDDNVELVKSGDLAVFDFTDFDRPRRLSLYDLELQ